MKNFQAPDLKEMISALKEKVGTNTVFVIGHKVVDVDSYISMLFVSNLLKKEGINAQPVILYNYSEIDTITREVVEKLNCEKIEYQEVSKEDFVFLVDHNNPFESIKDIDSDYIVGIIDHHQDEGLNAPLKVVEKSGSTTQILYSIYTKLGHNLSYEDKKKILYSLCIDTCSLMSSKAQQKDKDFGYELAKELNLDFNTVKKETLFETDLNDSINELILNGLKEYSMGEYSVASAYIEVIEKTDKFYAKLKEIFSNAKEIKYDLFVFIVNDFEEGKTKAYMFGKMNSVVSNKEYSFIASRGSTVIPEIRNELSNQ